MCYICKLICTHAEKYYDHLHILSSIQSYTDHHIETYVHYNFLHHNWHEIAYIEGLIYYILLLVYKGYISI